MLLSPTMTLAAPGTSFHDERTGASVDGSYRRSPNHTSVPTRLPRARALGVRMTQPRQPDQNPSKSKGKVSSLYHRIGGYDAIAAAIDGMLMRLRGDPQFARFATGVARTRIGERVSFLWISCALWRAVRVSIQAGR